MKLSISNLAMIKEAQIELSRPLTIFYGDNGAGKTCLAHIIYALARVQVPVRRLDIDFVKLCSCGHISLELSVDRLLEYQETLFVYLKANISKVYGVSQSDAKSLFSTFDIDGVTPHEEAEQRLLDIDVQRVCNLGEVEFKISKRGGSLNVDLELVVNRAAKAPSKELSALYCGAVYKLFLLDPVVNASIFSVERNSIHTFSKDLSLSRRNLAQRVQSFAYDAGGSDLYSLDKGSDRYPSAIGDVLLPSSDLLHLVKHKSFFYDRATSIESDLFGGELVVTKEGDLAFVSNKSRAVKQPIHICNSIVKSFSSLMLYLKYMAQEGDLIIIDEPEMNLHPGRQIEFARVFVSLLKSGFRLLINTHSDYIVKEINNMIMLDSIDDELLSGVANDLYSADMSLSAEEVSLYLFQYQNSKSRKVKITEVKPSATGFSVSSLDAVVEAQSEAYDALTKAITASSHL